MNRAHMLSSEFDGWVFCVLFQKKKKNIYGRKKLYGGPLFEPFPTSFGQT